MPSFCESTPESKWVDDALMLIGKSYFYQSNYVGAEQKFNEVIALNGSLHDDAIFWLSRTLVASQADQDAEDLIRTALASEDLEDKWRPRLLLLLGDLRTEVGDWEGAISALDFGLEDIDDGDAAARGQYLLGQLYETVGDYEKAIEAYDEVRRYKPLYELSFAAMFSKYRVEGIYRDPQVGIAGFEKMARDNKHFQYLDRIEYGRARSYMAAGDPIAARRILWGILYPPPGRPATSIRGHVHYRLGEMHRDLTGDFHLAAAHFDTAASSLRTAVLQNETYHPDAILDARVTADVFSTYREVADDVHRMDSLLYLGTLDQEEFDAAVLQVRESLAREAARAMAELERRQAQTSFQRAAVTEAGRSGAQNQNAGNRQRGRSGFLNHRDIQMAQEGFLSFRRIWGDRPLIPGWRREEVVLSTRSEQQDQLDQVDNPVQQQASQAGIMNFLPPVDISEVPRDSASRVAMQVERAAARYKLANVLFLSMALPDSAANWYGLVIHEDYDQPVALRARYALAEVYQSKGDQEAADRVLNEIVREYPDSEFADRARVTLGIELVDQAADSSQIALDGYNRSYELWNQGSRQEALEGMVRTAADYPATDVAAKALLAGAAIFTEMVQHDSLDLFGLIPLDDSLFTAEELAIARKDLEPEDTVAVVDSSAVLTLEDSAAVPETGDPSIDDPSTSDEVASQLEEAVVDSIGVIAEATEPQAVALDDERTLGEPVKREEEAAALLNVEDEALRANTGSADSRNQVSADEDEMLALRRRVAEAASEVDDEDPVRADDDEPVAAVVDSTADGPEQLAIASEQEVTPTEATADSVAVEVQPPPEPPKPPDWIEPRYFVQGIIPQPLTLHSLLTAVESNFTDTGYGQRAASIKRGLIAHRDEVFSAPQDSTQAIDSEALGSVRHPF